MKSTPSCFVLFAALLVLTTSCSKSGETSKSSGTQTADKGDTNTSDSDGKDELDGQSKGDQDKETQGKIVSAPVTADPSKSAEPNKPADNSELAQKELELINLAYAEAATKLNEKIEKLASDEEKAALFQKENPEPEFTKNLFALVKKYPETDSAFQAGMTIILEYPTNQEFPATMDLILEHHGSRVEWQKIASGYLELVPSLQIENWMRKMIEQAANDEVKVQMTFLLYRYFDQFPTFASTLEYNPQVKKRFAEDRIDYIYNRKQKVREELLKSLKELKEKHAEVLAQGNQKLKDVIDGPIFELEHLQVGSVAPDIEGKDFDGVDFRLSDYRGKVVMLDFWGQWCPPCRAMFPHERELIEQLVGKPFVLIGVNSDRRLETAIRATKDQNLVWRNFWCGPRGRSGPIAKKWNVSAWPTVYLIDGEGIIRYKEVLGREIDKGIEDLLAEMGHPVSLVKRPTKISSQMAERKQTLDLKQLLVKKRQ